MINLVNFSDSLKEIMLERQVSAEELSKAINYNQIYHWLNSDYKPYFNNLIKIVDYFKCSLDYLVGIKDNTSLHEQKNCPPFSNRLKFILKEKNFAIYKLSKLSKIDKRTIYDWLNNPYSPQLENLLKIKSILDCSLDYLVDRE